MTFATSKTIFATLEIVFAGAKKFFYPAMDASAGWFVTKRNAEPCPAGAKQETSEPRERIGTDLPALSAHLLPLMA
jgi:hypothetical protein